MTTRAWTAIVVIVIATTACTNDPASDVDPASRTGTSDVIETFAGTTPGGYGGDGGLAKDAKLGWLTGLTIDASGNLYISDGAANVIRKINPDNVISTIAGKFIGFNVANQQPYAGDGGPATAASLNIPFGAAIDPSGNIYICDAGNNVLRKVSSSGVISTIAGKFMEQGHIGDGGPASDALIWNPQGITTDSKGNVYFADSQNHTIRKISSTGVITTIAGTPGQAGYSGDGGPATAATLSMPQGVAVDKNDNIYFSDNSSVIRLVSAGRISTVAGTGVAGFSGDGGKATEAQLQSPKGIAFDIDGSLLVADAGNNRIRSIAPETAIISTIAGDGTYAYKGDGGPADEASIANPYGLAVDAAGNIYIADTDNGVIRVIKREN
jgi:sugar lactone lactonase YvrE